MNPLLLIGAAAVAADMLSDEGRGTRRLSKAEKEAAHAGVAEMVALHGHEKVKRGRFREIDKKLEWLETALGRPFRRPGFLEDALTHASAARPKNNERIEFLGDRILNFVLALWMYQHYDHLNEKKLTDLFAAATSNEFLAARARKLHLGEFAYLGKSLTPAKLSDRTMGGLFEAVVGALYLDGGLKPASEFVIREITPHLGALVDSNFKSQLIDWAAQQGQRAIFWGAGHTGPKDAPTWRVKAMLIAPGEDPRKAGRVVGMGSGRDKLAAEQAAAHMALRKLGVLAPRPMAQRPEFVDQALESAIVAGQEASSMRASA